MGPNATMRHSIIRRSLALTMFYISGHGFYYLLLLTANALLDPSGFGRLYTGWAILNVLVAPISIIALLFSAYFAEANSARGPALVVKLLKQTAAVAMPWTAAAVVLLEVLFFAGGRLVGVDSQALILVLPLTAVSFLGVEMVRASLQGMLRFTAYGISWFLWCVAQCAFGVVGLLLTRSPWGCFAGMLVANVLTLGSLCRTVISNRSDAPPTADAPAIAPYALRHALGFCSAFVGCVLFINADIFIAYLSLRPAELGVYTASNVLPKAIVTATQPIVQIILPVVASIKGEGQDTTRAVIKAIAAAVVLGAAAFCVLWMGSDIACGGPHGIRFCDPPLMLLLATSAVPLSVIRTLVTADIAHGRYGLPQLPFVAIVAFAAAVTLTQTAGQHPSVHLAMTYLFSCWTLLLFWTVAGIFRGRVPALRAAAFSALGRPKHGGS